MKKILVTLLLLMFAAATVSADNGDRLMTVVHEGEHNYFRVTAEPGDVVEIPYILENRSDEDLTNHILIYDSVSAVNGGNEVMSPDAVKAGQTGSWFGNNSEMITVGAHKNIRHSFAFNVPYDCMDGLYTAIYALYSEAETGNPEIEDDDIQLNINNFHTTTLAIVIEVGNDPVKSMELGDNVRSEIGLDGTGYIYVPVVNSGNTYEFPMVTIEVEKDGKTVFSGEKKMDIVYRMTETSACFETGDSLLERGEYLVKARIACNDADIPDSEKSYTLSIGKDTSEKAREHSALNAVAESGGGAFMLLDQRQLAWILIITMAAIFITAVVSAKIGNKRNGRISKP